MCGRYSNSLGPQQLARQVGDPLGVEIPDVGESVSHNIAPTDPVLTVVAPQGAPEARTMRWGLVPGWIKSKRPQINARLEGLRDTGKFLGVAPTAAHRALIVATEFIEWAKAEQGSKSRPAPFGFSLASEMPFCFAGMWVLDERADDESLASCTILTCDARQNQLVAPIHDRMPVMLADPEEWRAWLSPELSQREALSMCGPLAAERLRARPLPLAFNNSRVKEPRELFAAAAAVD